MLPVRTGVEGIHDRDLRQAVAPSRLRRRADQPRFAGFQGFVEARHRRRLPELCDGPRSLEGQGAGDRRQRAYALLHRASAPPARPAGRLTIRSMGLLKRITRSRAVQEVLGFAVARYLGLVRRTNRFVMEPADAYERVGPQMPVIAAMWHGQHFMIHFAKRPGDRAASLVSRSGDGELNAIALRHLGVRAIRGSGARGRDVREKGGVAATREMVRALANGEMVVLTADVPKIARVCGEGIVMLAKLSGRPIVPVAVVTSRRFVLRNW